MKRIQDTIPARIGGSIVCLGAGLLFILNSRHVENVRVFRRYPGDPRYFPQWFIVALGLAFMVLGVIPLLLVVHELWVRLKNKLNTARH